MRAARIAILTGLVIFSIIALLFAGSRIAKISYISLLEKGEPGAVKQILDNNMGEILEKYHLQTIASAKINLTRISENADTSHPEAERFFYIDDTGNITIKGLSDKNTPDDLSQKCVIFADAKLSWFKSRMLFEALINEKIRTIYAAALTPAGDLAYIPFEVAAPGAFPMLYRHRICLLSDSEFFEYFEEEEEIAPFTGLPEFSAIADRIRDASVSKNPFVRLMALDHVKFGSALKVLSLFKPSGIQAIVMMRTNDREYLLANVEELSGKLNKKKEEEK